jgi:membrane AbrB-like protein
MFKDRAAPVIGALLVAAVSGWLFGVLDLPLPWLLGPFLSVGIANLCGIRLYEFRGGRQTGQVIIGTAIGLAFTPAIARIVASHLPSMALVAFLSLVVAGIGAIMLRKIGRIDGTTAFFGTVPGGMSEMMVIGDRVGAHPMLLTVAQVVRVTILVLTLPAGIMWSGATGTDLFVSQPVPVAWPNLIALLAAGGLAAFALNALGMTNAWMLGSCALAAALTASGIEISGMPSFLSAVGQLLIGIMLGQRFRREEFTRAPRVVLGAIVSTIFLMAACLGLAVAVWSYSGLPFATLVAATAPGGLAEMSITAKVLNLGVPVVTAFHVMRVFMITLVTLPAYRALGALRKRAAQGR